VALPVMPAASFTPDDELNLLFDPQLIPDRVRAEIGEDLHARPLAADDLLRSHFGLLATLTVAPPIAPSLYTSVFQHLKSCPNTYYILVVVSRLTDQLVAHGTIVLERKFIHGGGLVAHIEDIVVSPDMRGRGLGLILVTGLKDLAVVLGCYKVILDCKEDRIPFYEKCGFEKRAHEMAYYPAEADATPSLTPILDATVPPPLLPRGQASLALPEVRQIRGFRPSSSLSESTDDGDPFTSSSLSITVPSEPVHGEDSPKTFNSGSSGSGITYHFPSTADSGTPDAEGMVASTSEAESGELKHSQMSPELSENGPSD